MWQKGLQSLSILVNQRNGDTGQSVTMAHCSSTSQSGKAGPCTQMVEKQNQNNFKQMLTFLKSSVVFLKVKSLCN
jgi:hypothetical protein